MSPPLLPWVCQPPTPGETTTYPSSFTSFSQHCPPTPHPQGSSLFLCLSVLVTQRMKWQAQAATTHSQLPCRYQSLLFVGIAVTVLLLCSQGCLSAAQQGDTLPCSWEPSSFVPTSSFHRICPQERQEEQDSTGWCWDPESHSYIQGFRVLQILLPLGKPLTASCKLTKATTDLASFPLRKWEKKKQPQRWAFMFR